MPSNPTMFAGVDLASGRKPVSFAALDGDLGVAAVENWDLSEALSCLSQYKHIWLCFHLPSHLREQTLYADFKTKITQAGFGPYPKKDTAKQWLETSAEDCFRALIGQKPLPRRTLEGRLQRSAILYEQGLQIADPVDMFEEITRYKLVQGILPLDNIFSSKELDALVAAYLAWMAVNRPGQIVAQGQFVLPATE